MFIVWLSFLISFSQTAQDTCPAENLAIGFESNKDVMKAWMDSPSHKENILNEKYNEIGLIVMQGDINGKLETIIVQIFGSQPVLRLSESFSKYIETSPLSLNHSYS